MKKFDIEEVMKRNEEDKFKYALSLVSHIFRNTESFSTQREVVNLILANSEDEEDACNLTTLISYIKSDFGSLALASISSDKEIKNAYGDCPLGYITKEEEDELAHKLFVYANSKIEKDWSLMSILSPAMEEEWMDIKSFVLLMLAVIDAISEE